MSRAHPLARAAVVVGALTLAWVLYQDRHFFHDDAYISLRYAWHWVHTGEIVWNPGEWVEGYTNALHLACTAALGALGVPWTTAPRLVNAAAALALLPAFWAATRSATRTGVLLGLALLLGTRPLSAWIWGGLEAPMVAACVLGAVAAIQATDEAPRWAPVAGLLGAAAILTRPDSAVAVGTAILWLGWRRRGPAITAAVVTAVPVLAHGAWRVATYGDLVPNTFHTKVGTPLWERLGSGVGYVVAWSGEPPYWPVLGPFAAYLAWRAPSLRRPLALYGGVAAAHVLYVLWAGGDHMPAFRFLLPVIPLLCVVWTLAMTAWEEDGASVRTFAGVTIALLGVTAATARHRERDPAAFVGEIVGRWMAEQWDDDVYVALHTAGSTPFLNPRKRFLDMLGLTDRHIATRDVGPPRLPFQRLPGHAKGDGAYVLGRAPDVIVLGFAEGVDAAEPVFLSDLEIAEDPAFDRCYRRRDKAIPYSDAVAAMGPPRKNPLVFTFYERTCD